MNLLRDGLASGLSAPGAGTSGAASPDPHLETAQHAHVQKSVPGERDRQSATFDVERLVRAARCILLRYETEHVPCTGITAVTRQERLHFPSGVMIAPWHSSLERAQASVASGAVRDTGYRFNALVSGRIVREARVLLSERAGSLPIVYLSLVGSFLGGANPYDTTNLGRDSLTFGALVAGFLEGCRAAGQWISGADWQTVPALHLLSSRFITVLTLHNVYDRHLAAESRDFEQFAAFSSERTALQVGMAEADVVTTVSEGFAQGLRRDAFHRLVMAPHIQPQLHRVVSVENAAFIPVSSQAQRLAHAIERGAEEGWAVLSELRQAAAQQLPPDLRAALRNRVVLVSMGRRSPQKQHDVLVECLRRLLREQPGLPIAAVFATTGGEPGAPARLSRIRALESEFPKQVMCIDGHIDFYAALMRVAHYNVLCSLWEPHGSAFEELVVPIARAVDGLQCQITPLERAHGSAGSANGFLYREPPLEDDDTARADLAALLTISPSPDNGTFRRMVSALAEQVLQAIEIALRDRGTYLQLLRSALARQQAWTWRENYAMLLALVRDARNRRTLKLPKNR